MKNYYCDPTIRRYDEKKQVKAEFNESRSGFLKLFLVCNLKDAF